MEIRTTREMALRAVIEILEMGKYTNKVTDALFKDHPELNERERAFIGRLIRGTVERAPSLDTAIDGFARPPVKKQKPYVRNLLRISTYQVLFMDGIRDAAAINEAVSLCKKHGFGGLSGFINAVLRRIAENKEEILEKIAGDIGTDLPEWINDLFEERFGKEEAIRISEAFLSEKPVYVRITDDTLLDELKKIEGIVIEKVRINDMEIGESETGDMNEGAGDIKDGAGPIYALKGCGDIRMLPGYEDGKIFIQDLGAMLILEDAMDVILAQYGKGDGNAADDDRERGNATGSGDEAGFMNVIDVCAAPGGKSIHLAQILNENGIDYNICARDLSEKKVRLMEQNIERSRLKNISAQVFDATQPDKENRGKADLVIADLPCSGLGVIGRKPDIKYRVEPGDIGELASLQAKILENAADMVNEGGFIIYATCTLTEQENEGQIASFVAKNANFRILKQKTYIPTPKNDGFFMCVLQNAYRIDIKSLNLDELKELMEKEGEKAFRAKQIYEWIHKKCVRDAGEMTNVPADLRDKIKNEWNFYSLEKETRQDSKDGTKKYLFRLFDGEYVESVFMPYHHGNSVCISSQVGCRMGCKFCASTLDGLARNLSAGEMLDQIYSITRDTNERISNVVVMGTGEPLDNYDNLIKFIGMLTDENGLNISQRNVTVSTCGLVSEIRRLADEDLKITLALSLHASTDEKRRRLMPIANKYSISELMDATDHYFKKTGRRITFEYSLVRGENDTKEDAEKLSLLAGKRGCHINLIPVNPVKERSFTRPDQGDVLIFKNMLEKNHINVTIRRGMGSDIDGACGQLRRRRSDQGG